MKISHWTIWRSWGESLTFPEIKTENKCMIQNYKFFTSFFLGFLGNQMDDYGCLIAE